MNSKRGIAATLLPQKQRLFQVRYTSVNTLHKGDNARIIIIIIIIIIMDRNMETLNEYTVYGRILKRISTTYHTASG
jgi:hypothetical protein